MNEKICCLCGRVIRGWSNSAWPVREQEKICCEKCNYRYVVPNRRNKLRYK